MSGLPLPSAPDSWIMSVASGWAPGALGVPPEQCEQLTSVFAQGAAVPQRFSAVVIRPPTAQDFQLAIQAGSEALQHARDPATRALLLQQDVLLRHQLTQRYSVSSSGSRSFNSLSTTGSSSAAESPRTHDVGGGGAAVALSEGVIILPSPAKVFRCPVCPGVLDERCFAKHIDSWLSRDGSKRLRSNQCPGIPPGHVFLDAFQGTHRERVRCLHATVRSMVHPGCVQAQTPQGSGNHLAVEMYFESLSR
jgi:hypothetical protein